MLSIKQIFRYILYIYIFEREGFDDKGHTRLLIDNVKWEKENCGNYLLEENIEDKLVDQISLGKDNCLSTL